MLTLLWNPCWQFLFHLPSLICHLSLLLFQLALLGACQCRTTGGIPCSCARAAAGLSKQYTQLQSQVVSLVPWDPAPHSSMSTDSVWIWHLLQVSEITRRYDDAAVVTDVYRVAFEEQLERNKELLRRLGDLTLTPPHLSRTEKAKAAVKWLIKQLNEGQLVLWRSLRHDLWF